jgi:hypothetical protein
MCYGIYRSASFLFSQGLDSMKTTPQPEEVLMKLRRSSEEVSFLRSVDQVRGPSYEVPTKIWVPKGQKELPVDAVKGWVDYVQDWN